MGAEDCRVIAMQSDVSFRKPPDVKAQPAKSIHEEKPKSEPARAKHSSYHRLSDTLRLYAGWLLAWYFLIFAVGSYQRLRPLPFRSAFLDRLIDSRLVLEVAVGTFLFLLLTGMHRVLGRGVLLGTALTLVGVAMFLLFVANAV